MTLRLSAITAEELHARLREPSELALLDIREEGVFAKHHILTASNVPLSRFEVLVVPLVPRLSTTIVLVDNGDCMVERVAAILQEAGYHDLHRLAGGMPAWNAAGLETFEGVFVPSKAFGEFVEVTYQTPHISALELQAKRDAGEPFYLIDSRPFDEFNWITIPGAIDIPGGELVLRVRETVKDETALVVVNCGGRTRSIIGAQILIDAGLPNPVVSLKDGTQGWHLAGLDVERGAARRAAHPGDDALGWAKGAARDLAERFAMTIIGAEDLIRFEAEEGETTLYRFDVRDPEEYRAGHVRGFRSAPGGQLVQATDTFIAVRQARIVLADNDGVRARATAAWLVRMGFAAVFVLDEAAELPTEAGDAPHRQLGGHSEPVDLVSVEDLLALQREGKVTVVDVATSRQYGAGHIPGAWFAVRGRLAVDAAALSASPLFVLTSPDGRLASLALNELRVATGASVKVLDGGTAAWVAEGQVLEKGATRLASEPDDVFLKAFERSEKREDAMRQYLQWELDLVAQVRRDGTLAFNL